MIHCFLSLSIHPCFSLIEHHGEGLLIGLDLILILKYCYVYTYTLIYFLLQVVFRSLYNRRFSSIHPKHSPCKFCRALGGCNSLVICTGESKLCYVTYWSVSLFSLVWSMVKFNFTHRLNMSTCTDCYTASSVALLVYLQEVAGTFMVHGHNFYI